MNVEVKLITYQPCINLIYFVQGTVKKVLSDFRRTHHDSWNEHKRNFTDDQLVVLTDLLISPSYYA